MRLRGELRLATPVASLRPDGDLWEIAWGGATPGRDRFDAVVLALPAFAAAPLCAPFSERLAAGLGAIPYAPLALVQLGVPEANLGRPASGFGLLDGDGSLSSVGTLFPSSFFPGRAPPGSALLASMVGGALRPELAALPDEELVRLCRKDLERTLGLRGAPSYVRIDRHARAIPQYEIGHSARLRELLAAAAAHPRLALCGAAYDGVSVDQCARGGARAAAEILSGLRLG